VCDEHRWPLNPAVSADPEAQAGSCVCEWDHGIVTGGLPLLLDALERAIGALRAGGAALDVDAAAVGEEEEEEEEDEEEDEAAYGGADWDTP
jgi:type III secretion protein L